MVRTPGFHPGNRGSIPLGTTIGDLAIANSLFCGESKEYKVYLFYKPDIEYLKNTALTLDKAEALGKYTDKKRLVFAPTKYLSQDHLDHLQIDFAQLPFEIYKLAKQRNSLKK